MRKVYKRKRRCCALCKPHKVGWDKRWKVKEVTRLIQMERECRNLTHELGRIKQCQEMIFGQGQTRHVSHAATLKTRHASSAYGASHQVWVSCGVGSDFLNCIVV
jgi:hypothetical protein